MEHFPNLCIYADMQTVSKQVILRGIQRSIQNGLA